MPENSQQLDLLSEGQPEPTLFDPSEVARKIRDASRPGGEEAAEDRRRKINERRGEDLGAEQTGLKASLPLIDIEGVEPSKEDSPARSPAAEKLFAETKGRRATNPARESTPQHHLDRFAELRGIDQ